MDKQRDHKYLLSFKGRSIDQQFSTVNTALAHSQHLPEHLKNVVPVQIDAGRRGAGTHPATWRKLEAQGQEATGSVRNLHVQTPR